MRLAQLRRTAPGLALLARSPQRPSASSCRNLRTGVVASTGVRYRIPGPTEEVKTIDELEAEQESGFRQGGDKAVRLVQWYPGHIARAERQLKEQLRIVDVVVDVRDARIPLSTGHPMLPAWIGQNKLRLVVMNQMDKISQREQSRWATYFSTQRNMRVIYTNGKSGEGVPKLFKAATSVSEELNAKRLEKGLQRRPVRVAVVGFPNVGKSALINRLVGRRQCESAQRAGVTRHLQWVSLGADGELMLLDAPGVLPMRLADQDAALRLAICNDIGEASYITSLVAADFVDQIRRHEDGERKARMLQERYKIPIEGMTGADFVEALAQKVCAGDSERAGRKILKDYQNGALGVFCLEQPPRPGEGAPGSKEKDYRLTRVPLNTNK